MKRRRHETPAESGWPRKRQRAAKEEDQLPLVDDMLRAVAAFLFTPMDYYALQRACRQTRRALSHAPFLTGMEERYFAPYRAVMADPMALAHAPVQTRDICLLALAQSGAALSCIREQTREYCLFAIGRFPRAIEHVVAQTEALCLAAIEGSPYILDLIKEENMTHAICLAAVERVAGMIAYVPQRLLTREMLVATVPLSARGLRLCVPCVTPLPFH